MSQISQTTSDEWTQPQQHSMVAKHDYTTTNSHCLTLTLTLTLTSPSGSGKPLSTRTNIGKP
jgi:hypothetical protein